MNARLVTALLTVVALTGAAAPAPAPIKTVDGLVITKIVQPAYPLKLRKRGVEGCVVLAFEVQPDGHAAKAEVLDSVPAGRFDQTSLKALAQWEFEPPVRKGRYAQAIQFQIDPKRAGKVKIVPPERGCKETPRFEALNGIRRELKIVSSVMPVYAPDANAPAGGACVTLGYEILPDGSVGEVKALDAAPGGSYVQAAIDAVKRWRFETFEPPAMYAQQTFTFDPELVRLPNDAIRPAFATATSAGAVSNNRCSVANAVKAKS
jgi:TonB family protein